MSPLPLVAIIVVNWNDWRATSHCLTSLGEIDYKNNKIFVIDNGSSEPAPTNDFPNENISFYRLERNTGYTGGYNYGIRLALAERADYILCLNSDTTVASDFLSRLIEAMESKPTAGFASPALYHQDKPDALAGLGCTLDFTHAFPGVALTSLLPDSPIEVPYVEGCVLLIRRRAAEQTGGFDDTFFAYFEDADLCLRGRKFGWRCIAVPTSKVWHRSGTTWQGQGSPTAFFYLARNAWLLLDRYALPAERHQFLRSHLLDFWRVARPYYGVGSRSANPEPMSAVRDRLVAFTLGVLAGIKRETGPREQSNVLWMEPLLRGVTGLFLPLFVPVAHAAYFLRGFTSLGGPA